MSCSWKIVLKPTKNVELVLRNDKSIAMTVVICYYYHYHLYSDKSSIGCSGSSRSGSGSNRSGSGSSRSGSGGNISNVIP